MFRPVRLVKTVPKLDYFRWHLVCFAVSIAMCVITAISLATRGLNLGVDFAGGVLMEMRTGETVDMAALRAKLGALDLGDVSLQQFGSANDIGIRIERQPGGQACVDTANRVLTARPATQGYRLVLVQGADGGRLQMEVPAGAGRDDVQRAASSVALAEQQVQFTPGRPVVINQSESQRVEWCQQLAIIAVRDALGTGYELRRSEAVGPKVGAELAIDGILAVSCALGAILAYMAFRFGWRASVSGVIALLHDCWTTLGLFSITGMQFDLNVLAAIVTIAGFSINDTVVIDDRIRENLRRYKKLDFRSLINVSVNETMARTLMTNGLVFLAVLALVLFGGPVLWGFSIALLWGVAVGTYSTIYVAAPLEWYMAARGRNMPRREEEERAAAARP
jgi:preprotein translocase subunit SecF